METYKLHIEIGRPFAKKWITDIKDMAKSYHIEVNIEEVGWFLLKKSFIVTLVGTSNAIDEFLVWYDNSIKEWNNGW